MSEEAPENYNTGDIVWVKLGPCWWPGEVKDLDELPNEFLDFKKPPLVIVKFFEEESYEYVRSWSNIFPYNSDKKNEFIKKGMAAFRAKVSHMEKFPKDVITAEVRVGGNPNILSDPMFLPEKKRNYTAEVFGTPSPKSKGNKDKKSRPSNKSSNQKDTHITHRRFLGVDDYRAYICIQYPGKDRLPGDTEDEEVLRINSEPEQEFNCHSCSFTTKRLEVMILHTKSHIRGICVSSSRRNKTVRKKKEKSKKSRSSDVIESESSSSDSEPIRERKRKPRPQSAKKSKVKEGVMEKEEPKPVIDIRSELLAVWDDSDEDEEFDLPLSKSTESEQALSQSITNIILGEITGDKLKEATDGKPKEVGGVVNEKSDEPMDETLKESADSTLDKLEVLNQTDDKEVDVPVEVTEISEKKSDENVEKPPNQSTDEVLSQPPDEAVNQLETVDKSNDEAYQPELPNQAVSKQLDESVEERVNHSKVEDQSAESVKSNDGIMQSNIDSTHKVPEKLKSTSDNKEPLEDDVKEKETEQSRQKMDQDIQAAIKSCFDFDEDDEEDSTILNKATVGRKIPRVIPPAERRKSHEITEEEVNPDLILKESDTFNKKTEESSSEDVDAAFKELMEMTTVPELPDVQNTLKCEQNFHNIKTIKFPDKLDPVGSRPPKVAMIEKKEPSDIATKLTNPKKRFVKSFEDFELMQNEIRRKEEQVDVVKGESKVDLPLPETNSDTIASSKFDRFDDVSPLDEMSSDFSIGLLKLKSKIMSTLIEEANINEESKNKIMSKMPDPENLKVREANTATRFSHSNKDTTVEKAGSSISHRTPRSKILELYRNDKNKHKVEEEEQKIEKVVTQALVEPRFETTINKVDIMNDRIIELLTRTEILPPKKNKWSRRGSHPKKDKSLFLLGDTATEESPFKQSESDTKADNLPKVDSQTPLETSSLNSVLSSSCTVVIEEIKPPATDGNVTAVSEITEEQKTERLLPAEENIELKEDSVTNIASRVEEAHKTPLVDEDMPLKDKDDDKVLLTEGEVDPATVHIGQEIDKPLSQEGTPVSIENDEPGKVTLLQTENNILPSNEVALGSLLSENEKEKLPEIVSNQEIARNKVEEEKENIRLDTKEVEAGVLPKDPVISADCAMGTESSAEKDNLLSKNVSLPAEKCVLLPERVMEDNTLNSNVTVEADQNVPTEVAEVPPLNSDVFPTVEGMSVSAVKDVISSPPKKSKKRKISDSYLSSFEGTDTSKEVSKAEFSPAEKKKREAEVEVDTNMEICPIPETEVELKDVEPSKSECKPELPHTEVNNTDTYQQESLLEKTEEVMSDSAEELTRVMDHKNEVEIHCASSSPDSFKFSIQTNLSNLTSREEISALALATLSEIKADLENSNSNVSEEKVEEPEKTVVPPIPADSELVPIEGNLTVVSEKDLADGQVEITTQQVISPKKPLTMSNFSMDFSDSASDSNSTSDTFCDFGKCTDFSARGTEFTSKAITNITKQIKKVDRKKENAYERLELLNILEGNSDTEKKPKDYPQPSKSVVDDICDFEEHIPSQIVCAKTLKREGAVGAEYPFMEKEKTDKLPEKSIASKLLERLTEPKERIIASKTNTQGDAKSSETTNKPPTKRQGVTPSSTRSSKYLSRAKPATTTGKPVILSEQIVKPATETVKSKPKKLLNDIEDVEAFVIHKDPKKRQLEQENSDSLQLKSAAGKHAGKAKILQQTIITPAGEIIQPTVQQAQTDDNIFDINSMPIVLSDEILTPESIENMPIMIGTETKSEDQDKTLKRSPQSRIITKTTVAVPQPIPNKTITISKQSKQPRILQTVGNRVIKNSPLLPSTAKPGKYIIVPQSGIQPAKYISKKAPVVKRSPVPTSIVSKIPTISPEPSGNKIMIVTNQQGQQQRLLLTPAQQKMLGYQNQKVTKTVVKGNVMQKSVLATKTVPLVEAGTSGIVSKGPSIVGQKVVIGTSSTGIISTTSSQIISNQGKIVKGMPKKLQPVSQKTTGKTQKTILIKNQHGQTVRKIQGTDDELLDKQVAEQLEAIKASAGIKFSSQSKPIEQPYKTTPKTTVRRSYAKKLEGKPKVGPPPLSSFQVSSKPETVAFPVAKKAEPSESKPSALVTEEAKPQLDRPLNQLVIQDAVGNQTTITEGQILALPSETVDGQPQSYMLVTLDESGNLTPLNSEALMSLDPNLGLGGDLSNMVLQIDQGALTERPQTIALKASLENESAKLVEMETPATVAVPEASVTTEIAETVVDQKIVPVAEAAQTIPPSTNGDPGQQLIVTGDPIATQKFLESLTEGTTDLANILANAEGNSILIQADGQQILINTNSDNQMLLSMNNDNVNVSESSEGGGNPIFATQPSKNQDILAAALADTDVFQQEQHASQGKITSQLSPSNALYPMNVGNVLETSLTLSSPIMTPLELPSTNNKKIPDDEADILTQVPKNVDLPITITDPNISQTVANQQVASLIASELQTNLELALPISETTISSVSTEMNSPSYVYSLPTLDESVDINQKPFNSNMPLLNEDIDESANKVKVDTDSKIGEEETKQQNHNKPQNVINSRGNFLEEEEGRFTLGGEMCSSLSEPPPEMFDLPEDDANLAEKRRPNIPSSLQSTPDVSDNASKDDDTTDLSTQAETSSEGSCEIPLQPQIVTKSLDLSSSLDPLKRSLEESEEEDSKKCKFD